MEEKNTIYFSIYECEIPFFSNELKESLVSLTNCISCEENPNSDLSPCCCGLEFDHPLLSYLHMEKNCGAKTFGPFNTCNDFLGTYKATRNNWKTIEVHLKRDTLKERSRRSSRNRRQREKLAQGFHEDSDIKKIYTFQYGMCCFCGIKLKPFGQKDAFQKEHLKPFSKGGTNWPHNIALACPNCNRAKHNKELSVYWNKLKKIKGEDFIEKRKFLLKSSYGEKIKLTNIRKKSMKSEL